MLFSPAAAAAADDDDDDAVIVESLQTRSAHSSGWIDGRSFDAGRRPSSMFLPQKRFLTSYLGGPGRFSRGSTVGRCDFMGPVREQSAIYWPQPHADTSAIDVITASRYRYQRPPLRRLTLTYTHTGAGHVQCTCVFVAYRL